MPSRPDQPPGAASLAVLARSHELAVSAVADAGQTVGAIAFDDFVFEPNAIIGDGVMLERGVNAAGVVLATASFQHSSSTIDWLSIRSRHGVDHVRMVDELTSVGDREFNAAFAIDTEDAADFDAIFSTDVRSWLIDFDSAHGPLTIILCADDVDRVTDGSSADSRTADASATGDRTADAGAPSTGDAGATNTGDAGVADPRANLGSAGGNEVPDEIAAAPISSTLYVAREVADDDAFISTRDVVAALSERLGLSDNRGLTAD